VRVQVSASVSHKYSSSSNYGGQYLSVVAQLRLTACWQGGNLHYTVGSGCCGSGLGIGTGLAWAPSADSELPLATGTTSGRGMVLATSLDSRGLWHN